MNVASGEPVKIGYISDGTSAVVDNLDEMLTAVATFDYINERLGGLSGRPIEVVTCEVKGDAALATECADRMLHEDVVAVVSYVTGQEAPIAEVLQGADMPWIAGVLSGAAADPDTTVVFANGLSAVVHPAAVARDNGVTKTATIVIDVPTAVGIVDGLGAAVMANAGVTDAEVVTIPPGTADMGPQVQAALGNEPELVHVFGNASFCATALDALEIAGYDGIVTAVSSCIDGATIEAAGSYIEGIKVGYPFSFDMEDPDFALFPLIVEQYADDPSAIEIRPTTANAYATVISFWRALEGIPADDITSESVLAKAKAASGIPLALGGGLTFTCDGTAVPVLPAVCTAGMLEAVLDAEGQPTDFTPVDAGTLLSIG